MFHYREVLGGFQRSRVRSDGDGYIVETLPLEAAEQRPTRSAQNLARTEAFCGHRADGTAPEGGRLTRMLID